MKEMFASSRESRSTRIARGALLRGVARSAVLLIFARSMMLLGVLGAISCKDTATTSDAGADLTRPADGGRDMPLADLPGAGDQRPGDTRPRDTNTWDFWIGDAVLSHSRILYTITADPGSFGLLARDSASAGPTPVPGWSGYLSLDPLSLAGIQEYVPVSPQLPRPQANLPQGFRGITLPQGAGSLYYYHKKLVGVSGLLLIRGSGELETILEVPGIYADTLAPMIALTPLGDRGAVVHGKSAVLLFRTDGVAYPSGESWLDLTSSALELEEIYPRSLTMAAGWLYCVARDAAGIQQVLRAPTDGSGVLEPVPLPQIHDQDPSTMGTQFARSGDGQHLVIPAGPQKSQQDLFHIHAASGAANRVMASPGPIAEPGDSFGYQEGMLALSPSGSRVAYLQGSPSARELYVAPTDGSGEGIQISASQRFQNPVTALVNLFWGDEHTLYFMAGESTTQLAIFSWDASTSTLSKLLGGGLNVPPFNGQASFSAKGGWVSPEQKWLYLILYDATDLSQDIVGVDLKTRSAKKITDQIQVQGSAGSLVACASSGQLYFAAKPRPQINESEVWGFDQEVGQTAARLTNMSVTPTNSWFVNDLTLSADCSWLAWSAGRSSSQRGIWTLQTGGPLVARKSTLVPSHISSSLLFSPDHASIIYGAGGAQDTASLKGLPLQGGQPTNLDPSAGYLNIFSVY